MVQFKITENIVYKLEESGKQVQTGAIVDGVYECRRNAKEHYHRLYDGWGADVSLLNTLDERGIKYVKIYDKYFNESHYTDIQTFRDFGIEEEYGEHGKQYILPKLYWGIDPDYQQNSKGFVQLHLHTEFSTLDGMGHIEELVLKARRMGMNSLAISDHGNLFGVYKFHKVCNKAGIKPILGCEFYLVDDHTKKEDKSRNHLVLLAKNRKGYENLLKLSTISHLKGFYYRPRIDKKMLEEHRDGLIALSACFAGCPQMMLVGDSPIDQVQKEILWWKQAFGDDYYLELHADKLDEYVKINPILIDLAKECGVEVVATNDVHYPSKKDFNAHMTMLGINFKKNCNELEKPKSNQYWMKSKQEMVESYQEFHPRIPFDAYERAIANTQAIADKVESFDVEGEHMLPKMASNFSRKVKDVWEKSAIVRDTPQSELQVYKDRARFEYDTIQNLGFEDYFLLIADIVNYAKDKGIQIGAGRGSVSGSLIAFLLGITEVDPIKYGLLFERFLNPARKSMPDIDIDVEDERREEVFEYINKKWKTAKISTFVGLQGKGAIKDCCRFFDIPFSIAEMMSRAFPTSQTHKATLDEVILDVPEFGRFFEQYQDMLMIARRLEGRIKTKGIHPAGIIVSDEEVENIVALRYSNGSTGDVVIQCDMDDVERLGLLKLDLLGSKAQTTLSIVRKMTNVGDLKDIPLNDKKVYREFKNGNCLDIFQFQTDLGRDTVMKVKPEDFETLTAITALVRPSSYDFIESFAKNDYEPIMEELRPILKDTRNIILYQEQSMKIAVEIAGFSLEKADDLRRAIGKKKADVMQSLRKDFVNGGVKRGFNEGVITELFDIIEKSANYSFNKSHAVAYGLTAYWAMWFKVHHPLEWSVAKLSVYQDDEEKLKRYIEDTISNGIKVLPPDINKSEWGFRKEGDAIRCGLGMVKKISQTSYIEIAQNRPYMNWGEFFVKVSGRKCNRGAIQNLIKAGAFDSFGLPRKGLSETIVKLSGEVQDCKLKANVEWSEQDKSKYEREALGFYLQGHPIKHYVKEMEAHGVDPMTGFTKKGTAVRVIGVVDTVKDWKCKTGVMAFVEISGFQNWSINVWPSSWVTYNGHIKEGDVVIVCGRIINGENKLGLDVEKGDQFVFLT